MNDTLASFIRHALTGAGVYLTSKGIGDEAMWQAVIGGIMAIVGFVIMRKKKPAAE